MQTLFSLLLCCGALAQTIEVGGVPFRVPSHEKFTKINTDSKQFSIASDNTAPGMHMIYLEALDSPAQMANSGQVVDLQEYNVIKAFRSMENKDVTEDVFASQAPQLADNIKTTLKQISSAELQTDLSVGNAKSLLVDDIQVNTSLRFASIQPIEGRTGLVLMASITSMKVVKHRLLVFYSYMTYHNPQTIDLLWKQNDAFISRVIKENTP